MGHRSPDIDAYIENAAPEHREALEALRSVIHVIHPDIIEAIAYKMPTFTLDGDLSFCAYLLS